MSESIRKRGRPIGTARIIATKSGLSVRTVQRALTPKRAESPQDRMTRQFLTSFRNFASFCRDNRADEVAALPVTEAQAAKLAEWNSTVRAWLDSLNGAG